MPGAANRAPLALFCARSLHTDQLCKYAKAQAFVKECLCTNKMYQCKTKGKPLDLQFSVFFFPLLLWSKERAFPLDQDAWEATTSCRNYTIINHAIKTTLLWQQSHPKTSCSTYVTVSHSPLLLANERTIFQWLSINCTKKAPRFDLWPLYLKQSCGAKSCNIY